MSWVRVLAKEKLAFREDLQTDPTLTDVQKRMISVIAQHWDNAKTQAECSRSFIAVGAGTVPDVVKRYIPKLLSSGRVSIKRKHDYTNSTLWDVNWWFRGSAWVRLNNGGQPIQDCRKVGTSVAHEERPMDAQGSGDQQCMGGWGPRLRRGWGPSGPPIPL